MHIDPLRLVLVVTLGLALLAPRTLAEEDAAAWQRKLDQARQQIQKLVERGRELEAMGNSADAQDMFARAEKMEVAIRRAVEKAEQKARSERKPKPNDRKRLLGEVKRSVRALERLGYEDAAQQVRKILKGVFAAESRRATERSSERKTAAQLATVMKIAVHGLVEIDRHDLAHRLEHGVHALELTAAGRDDQEAKTVRKTAPRLAEMRGLVEHGIRAWRELGNEQHVAKLEWLLGELAREEASLDAIDAGLARIMRKMLRLGEDLERLDAAEKPRR